MIAAALVAWLIAQPVLLDGHGAPIPRRAEVVDAIAVAAAETCSPKWWAALLDVWAAYESGYRDIGGGCDGVAIGTACDRARAKYVSPWMLSRGRVPRDATIVDEARVAIAMFRESFAACPAHPYSFFAAGDCREHRVVDFRLQFVRRELAQPIAIEVQ